MALADMIYNFFGFQNLSASATFVDLISSILKIGCGLWVTIFLIRSMMLALTIPEKGF